jgi:outer membrane protein TolC
MSSFNSINRRPLRRLAGVALLLAASVTPATAQDRAACSSGPNCTQVRAGNPADSAQMSLEDALRRALGKSEEVQLARAAVELAGADVTVTRAQVLPQVNASLNYTRTYFTPFNVRAAPTPDSMKFQPDSMASILERLRYIEQNAGKAALGSLGGLFGNLPLGRPNTYVATITGTQVLYSGGRTGAALRIASDYKRAAQSEFTEQVSQIAMQVRTSYVRAALAQQLESIAQTALDQALAFQAQQKLRLDAGTASELDLLRAEVSAENLRPQLVDARNAAEVAALDLKRLIDVPLTQPLRLTTALDAPAALQADTLSEPDPTRVSAQRAAVAVAERQVAIRQQQVSIARGSYLPQVDLRVNYGAQNLPNTTFGFTNNPWNKDVSAGIGVSLPLFTGFRRGAEMQQAQIELTKARLQLGQLKESVQLQYQQARGERQRALSTIAARQRTVEQAQRVHDLTVLRFERGLSTQLEVSDARLALLQARTNVAQAIADFHIADANVERALGRAPNYSIFGSRN